MCIYVILAYLLNTIVIDHTCGQHFYCEVDWYMVIMQNNQINGVVHRHKLGRTLFIIKSINPSPRIVIDILIDIIIEILMDILKYVDTVVPGGFWRRIIDSLRFIPTEGQYDLIVLVCTDCIVACNWLLISLFIGHMCQGVWADSPWYVTRANCKDCKSAFSIVALML